MKKVLAVEDEKMWHNVWRRQIEFSSRNGSGIILISAFSVEEAEEQFAANPDLDAIVMDACVPGRALTTPPLVRKFREIFKGPMVAISGDEEYQEMLLKAGCDHRASKEAVVQKLFEIFGI